MEKDGRDNQRRDNAHGFVDRKETRHIGVNQLLVLASADVTAARSLPWSIGGGDASSLALSTVS